MKLTKVLDIELRHSDLPEPQGEILLTEVHGCEITTCRKAKFFAVDLNGEGHVFTEIPEWNGDYWMITTGYARYVGNFDLEGITPELSLVAMGTAK